MIMAPYNKWGFHNLPKIQLNGELESQIQVWLCSSLRFSCPGSGDSSRELDLQRSRRETGRWPSATGIRGWQGPQSKCKIFLSSERESPAAAASGVGLPEGRRNSIFPGGKWACEYQVGLISWGPHRQIWAPCPPHCGGSVGAHSWVHASTLSCMFYCHCRYSLCLTLVIPWKEFT